MSLRSRLPLLLVAIVIAAMFLTWLGTTLTAPSSVRSAQDRTLVRQVDALKSSRNQNAALRALVDGADRGRGNRGGLEREDQLEQLLFADGALRILGQSESLPVDGEDLRIAGTPGEQRIRTVEIDGRSWRMITAHIDLGGRDAAIQIARSDEDFNSLRRAILGNTLWSALVASLLAAVGGWLFSRRLTTPIGKLTETTERVSATQDLSARIQVSGSDEVGRLGTSFNAMLDALESSRVQQHQLVQDANHELRTPLTSLRTNVELLQRNENMDPAIRQDIMSAVRSELDELTSLVEELVASATDLSQTEIQETFDLEDVAQDVAERSERRTGRAIELTLHARGDGVDADDSSTLVIASRTHVERAVSNMVANAVKFGGDGVRVRLTIQGNTVIVDDDGPGIDAADREHVFQRFYRSVAARSVSGSGLGLAMVQQVATASGGRCWVEDSPLGGARVGLTVGSSAQRNASGR